MISPGMPGGPGNEGGRETGWDPDGDCGPGMDCGGVRDHLDEFIDHQIDSAAQAAIESHLSRCHGCHAEVDVESLVKELVARSCREAAPEYLRTRVVSELFSWRIQIDWPR